MIDTVLILLVIFSALILNESIVGFSEYDVQIIFSVTTAVLYLSVLAYLRVSTLEQNLELNLLYHYIYLNACFCKMFSQL